jgi:hypothetical protein
LGEASLLDLADGRNVAGENFELLLAYQSLLSQFSNTQVRADFVNGKFGPAINPHVLPQLDELRWTLFPRWQGGVLEEPNSAFRLARVHADKLLARSAEVAATSVEAMSDGLTYGQWSRVLQSIATDKYWLTTPADKRCTHIIGGSQLINPQDAAIGNHDVQEATAGPMNEECPNADVKPPNENKKEKNNDKKSRQRRIEEIVLSSSSDDTDTESASSSSDESGESSSSSDEVVRRKPATATKRKKDHREVVTPPPFDKKGKVSFNDFLGTYESYFKSKFKGNGYDMCQQLESFLKDDLLNVYQIRGGRRIKYKKMKKLLLEYYKKQRIGGRNYWRKEFSKAVPNADESLDLYGIRLLELSEAAFPKSSRECASQVRQQFLKSIHQTISTKVLDAERALKATSGGKRKYLKFSAIMTMAKDLQEEIPRQHSVMWSDQVIAKQTPQVNHDQHHQAPSPTRGRQFRSRTFSGPRGHGQSHFQPRNERFDRQQQRGSREVSRENLSNRGRYCSLCGKQNHAEENCWRANNRCVICGEGHLMRDCPRYDPQYSRRPRQSSANHQFATRHQDMATSQAQTPQQGEWNHQHSVHHRHQGSANNQPPMHHYGMMHPQVIPQQDNLNSRVSVPRGGN